MCLILMAAKNVECRDQRDAVLELIGPSCLQYDLVDARQSQLLQEAATRLGICSFSLCSQMTGRDLCRGGK